MSHGARKAAVFAVSPCCPTPVVWSCRFILLAHPFANRQKLMHKLERKAQRRAAGKVAGSSAAVKELGDEDADWVRWGLVRLAYRLEHHRLFFAA